MEIRIYETEQGELPFLRWLNSLRDRNARARIRARLDRVERGNLGDFKIVGEGVLELRVDYGPGYRLYCAQVDRDILLLLIGGDKRTQVQDIAQAKMFLTDFKRRENANE